ncbi:lysylphosphatidylglycerol synthase domain-containing protein [Alcaligenes sp. HNGD-HTN06]|jgi:hypothetical protein|uniref:lysylphosphatidylglycerol synthase domain-containing protein n=1 Tax=Alcaligenes sp. HNGD-HTN06 TaxID=3416924 RepID=UPI003CF07665
MVVPLNGRMLLSMHRTTDMTCMTQLRFSRWGFWLSALIFLLCTALWLTTFPDLYSSAQAPLWIPLGVYLLAHCLRAIRLSVLLGARQLRPLLGMYFYTAACSAIIPFKLGELVRINEVAWWTNSYWKGLLIVWVERVFDVAALILLALLAFALSPYLPGQLDVLLWAMGGFVLLTLVVFFIVPEQLASLNLHVMRSYQGRKAIGILRLLDSFQQLLDQARPLLSGKTVTLSLLTILIWLAELSAYALLFQDAPWRDGTQALVMQLTLALGSTASIELLPAVAQLDHARLLLLVCMGVIALGIYTKMRQRLHNSPP